MHLKRVGVIVAGAALLVSGGLVGGPDMSDAYQDGRGELVALSGDPGSVGLYRNAAKDGQRVGATGISGDGADHSWSVAFMVSESVPPSEGGPLFGVQFS
jgi:hypothetical protein